MNSIIIGERTCKECGQVKDSVFDFFTHNEDTCMDCLKSMPQECAICGAVEEKPMWIGDEPHCKECGEFILKNNSCPAIEVEDAPTLVICPTCSEMTDPAHVEECHRCGGECCPDCGAGSGMCGPCHDELYYETYPDRAKPKEEDDQKA
jgi:hypothetical protein